MHFAMQLLMDHELDLIDCTCLGLTGDPEPGAPLDTHLAHVATWKP